MPKNGVCRCVNCQKVGDKHPNHSKGTCFFTCWECKKKEVDIRCFKCQKIVPRAYFKSPERKELYQAGDIIYVCAKCVAEEEKISQNYVAEVRGVWAAIGKDARQAEINGKRFEKVIKKEKKTGKY